MELLSEPLYILAACRLLFGLRVGVEAAAQAAKGVLTLALVRRPGTPPAIAFSWAQLAYAAVTLAGYCAYFLPRLLLGGRGQGGVGRPRRRQQQQQQQQEGEAEPADGAAAGQAAAAAAGAKASGSGDGEILRLAGTFTLQARGSGVARLQRPAPACRLARLALAA